jgi:universal stress protein A
MKSFSNILCATDFSDHCRIAAERAADLAQRYGAQLTVLHVVEHFPVDRSNSDIAPEDIDPKRYHEEKAQQCLAELTRHLDRPNVRQEVRFSIGSAQHEILRFVEEHAIDLVVIASHGRHGITTILGSTTYGMTHKCPCDVLAVRAKDS